MRREMSKYLMLGRHPGVLGEPTPILRTAASFPHLHDMTGRESLSDHFLLLLDAALK
jgi:hypothetical protein